MRSQYFYAHATITWQNVWGITLLQLAWEQTEFLLNLNCDVKSFVKWTRIKRIILCMGPANEIRRYIVTSSLVGLVHTQNDLCNNTSFTTSKADNSRGEFMFSGIGYWSPFRCIASLHASLSHTNRALKPRQNDRRHCQIYFLDINLFLFLSYFHSSLFPRFQLTLGRHLFG